jgi:cold shock CspA family protein
MANLMTGTITRLDRSRGLGSVVGEDGKTYSFRRSAVRDGWFHDLSEGANVTFEAGESPRELEANLVRLVRPSS